MKIFEVNTEIYVGDKFDEIVNKIKPKKVFIVTDSVMSKIGMTKKFENILIKKNIEYKIFDEVEVDPAFEIINKALDKVIDFLPDIVVGIGGGSSLDTAKSIKYFIKKSNLHIPLIALPTTSGTGSEVTSYAVLTDKKNNIKIPLKDDEMIPEYAILDPDLTKTLPKSVVADSGIDALTHAIESYTCKGANFYTKVYALSAIRLIFKNLLRMYRDIKDEEARTEMAKASCIAGFAFEKSGLGINHSVAHAIGGKFHIAHGKINGIILPYVIRFNSEDKTTAQRYYEISKDLGFPANSIEEGAESLALAVELLNKSLNLPSCVKDLAIDEEKYRNEIEFMSKSALEDICTSGNIREVNLEDLKKLFGGTENWELLKKTAQESKDGYADFTTIYGQKQELSTKWFADLEEKDFATLMQEVKKSYNGPSMVIYAVDDTAVSPSVSKSVAEELGSEIILTPEDGHSYGFYSDKAYVKRIVVENTVDFFKDKLMK